MTAGMPARPADLPYAATLAELAADYHRHAGRLVDAHHNVGQALPADELAAHAVAALATAHALAERALRSRWCTARDALRHGATVGQVAAGMGLDPVEVAGGLARWADGQHSAHLMGDDERAEVLRLAGGAR